MDVNTLSLAVAETLKWQKKTEKAARFYFLLLLAASGVPWPHLRLIALFAVILLFFRKIYKYYAKHNWNSGINIHKLNPQSFIGNSLMFALVTNAKKRTSPHRALWGWLGFSTYFGLACFFATCVEIEKSQKNLPCNAIKAEPIGSGGPSK
jgi:hypothetical protein